MARGSQWRRRALIPVVLLMKDHQRQQPLAWREKLPMLMHGFTSESVVLYSLTADNYQDYLSDYHLMKTRFIHNEAAYFLNHKVAFVEMLEGLVQMPKTLAVISQGRYESKDERFGSLEDIVNYLQADENHKLVLKPILGAEGRGVSVLKMDEGKIHCNDQRMSVEAFRGYIQTLDAYFFSEFIVQAQFSSGLFAHSLNTIRILTMVDPYTEQAFIAAATYRVGTQRSKPTDNFRRGGLSVDVDWESGTLGQAVSVPQGGKLHWHEWHPDTGELLTGQVVPHWDQVKAGILAVADYIYQAKRITYCGWDVVLTDEGLSLLEGNSIPGVSLHQVHQPLLLDPLVRAFYEHYGII